MQAIRTRYHGPSDTKGSRVSAACEAGKIFVNWDSALNVEENHKRAMQTLAAKMKWDDRKFVGGVFAHDYYWVME